jgi:hypothetical protein
MVEEWDILQLDLTNWHNQLEWQSLRAIDLMCATYDTGPDILYIDPQPEG